MPEYPIPIFDCLTHPTMDGGWLRPGEAGQNRIERLLEQMETTGVRWALAVGMGGVGGYREEDYTALIRSHSRRLFPVAYVDFDHLQDGCAEDYVRRLQVLGYVGIKIHPRRAAVTYADARVAEVIRAANARGLAVLVCTYGFEAGVNCQKNSLEGLVELLVQVREERLILLHGGTVRLLELAEVARSFRNVLVDLSFTLCKYAGSSLDLDIAYLFRTFDQRICVGSDSPEFGLQELRARFDLFAQGLDRTKAENIAYRNLATFTNIELP